MGTRLYVGNLSFNTSQDSITAAFSGSGEVREVSMPTDRETGQPRGFAFVTMGSEQQATAGHLEHERPDARRSHPQGERGAGAPGARRRGRGRWCYGGGGGGGRGRY